MNPKQVCWFLIVSNYLGQILAWSLLGQELHIPGYSPQEPTFHSNKTRSQNISSTSIVYTCIVLASMVPGGHLDTQTLKNHSSGHPIFFG